MKTATEKMPEGPRHVIRLGHVPYGFFEREIFGYFSQFGKVKRVRVCRNRKGHHTGAAFVEFVDAEVAKIAAQTMDNYLLAENRLRCRVMETVPKIIQAGPRFGKITMPGQNRFRHAQVLFGEKTPEHETHQRNRMVEKLREKMQKLEAQGINYHFDFERKLKEFLSIHGIADEKGEEDHLDLKRAKKDIAPESDS